MKRTLFLIAMFYMVSVSLWAENEKISGYIDIPTARTAHPGLYLNLSGSYAFGEDPYSVDVNGIIGLSINNLEFYLSGFTLNSWVLDFKYTFLKKKNMSFAFGVDRITYQEYITPVGSGESTGYTDERYITRPPEWFSAYVVGTFPLGDFLEATVGLGRGKFVGYGPRSRYFNIDYFFNREGVIPVSGTHPEYAVGLFGGIRIKFTPFASLVIEEDGRDVNTGLVLGNDKINVHLTLTKLEQITDLPLANVRMDLSVGAQVMPILEEKTGFIVFRIYDQSSKSPLPALVKFYNAKGKLVMTVNVPPEGIVRKEIPAGRYKIRIESKGYRSKTGRLRIRENKKIDLKIGLLKKLSPEEVAVIEALKRARNKIGEGDLLGAMAEVNGALKILPSSSDALAMKKEVEGLIEAKVSELRKKAIALEKSNPSVAIRIWQEVLRYKPGNKEIVARIDKLNSQIKAASTKARRKPARKTSTTTKKPAVKKPSKATLNNWYKQAVRYYMSGKYRQAYNLLTKILKYDPNNKRAKRYLKKVKAKL